MSEQYDFKGLVRESTFFNLLLLSGEVSTLTKEDTFDSSDLTVKLEINGHEVLIKDFNEVLNGWAKRIRDQVNDENEFMSHQNSVSENANILLKERMGRAYEILEEIEYIGVSLLD